MTFKVHQPEVDIRENPKFEFRNPKSTFGPVILLR